MCVCQGLQVTDFLLRIITGVILGEGGSSKYNARYVRNKKTVTSTETRSRACSQARARYDAGRPNPEPGAAHASLTRGFQGKL